MKTSYALELLVHTSQCRSKHSQDQNCRKIKGLFRHGNLCKTRASGGCRLCRLMWFLLMLHCRACKESVCLVPRCRDLREHMQQLALGRRDIEANVHDEVDVLKGLQMLEPNVEEVDALCSQLQALMEAPSSAPSN